MPNDVNKALLVHRLSERKVPSPLLVPVHFPADITLTMGILGGFSVMSTKIDTTGAVVLLNLGSERPHPDFSGVVGTASSASTNLTSRQYWIGLARY